MIKQVTTLTNTSAAQILLPSPNCHFYNIQNNGSGNVRLSFDGGANWNFQPHPGNGTNPTTTTGYKLTAGAYVTITLPGSNQPPPIVGILETATTTTLDITTDDSQST